MCLKFIICSLKGSPKVFPDSEGGLCMLLYLPLTSLIQKKSEIQIDWK